MPQNQFYVYIYKDPKTNTPVYVGKGQGKRAWDHFKSHRHLGCFLRKRQKEGEYILPRVFPMQDERSALDMEKYLVVHYGRKDLGTGSLFNLTNGGEGATGPKSDITRAKLSAAHKGKSKPKISMEHRKRISEFNKGRVVSDETRAKISAAHKGKTRIGHAISDETKAKISAANKGNKLGPQSAETIAKRVAAFNTTITKRKEANGKIQNT
jgi:hypothetical protein